MRPPHHPHLSLMLLLANFTVHSMSHSVAAAAIPPTPPTAAVASVVDAEPSNPRFDTASVKTFSIGRTASVGGGSGGGGDARPVAGTPVDYRWDESRYSLSRVAPQQLTPLAGTGAEKVVPDAAAEDEQAIWEKMVAEASHLQANARAEELTDPEVLVNLVAPVVAEMETEDIADYARTEQRYELAVSEEPNNSLILANFAQFLYLTRNDHKRADVASCSLFPPSISWPRLRGRSSSSSAFTPPPSSTSRAAAGVVVVVGGSPISEWEMEAVLERRWRETGLFVAARRHQRQARHRCKRTSGGARKSADGGRRSPSAADDHALFGSRQMTPCRKDTTASGDDS